MKCLPHYLSPSISHSHFQNISNFISHSVSPQSIQKIYNVFTLLTHFLFPSQIIEPPQENIKITIYGLENTSQEISTITVQIQDTELFKSMDINNSILMDFLNIATDADNFEDALMAYLPKTLNVIFCNGCILEILEEC